LKIKAAEPAQKKGPGRGQAEHDNLSRFHDWMGKALEKARRDLDQFDSESLAAIGELTSRAVAGETIAATVIATRQLQIWGAL
jgi:hypothetical protein